MTMGKDNTNSGFFLCCGNLGANISQCLWCKTPTLLRTDELNIISERGGVTARG